MKFCTDSFDFTHEFHFDSAQWSSPKRTSALPIAILAWAVASGRPTPWLLVLASQAAGLLVERWFFFAQARHPQNIYYQVVS